MRARLDPDGSLWIPLRAEGPDGVVGDGMVKIDADDPRYDEWLPYADKASK